MRATLLVASLCSIAVSAAAQTPQPDPGPLTDILLDWIGKHVTTER